MYFFINNNDVISMTYLVNDVFSPIFVKFYRQA